MSRSITVGALFCAAVLLVVPREVVAHEHAEIWHGVRQPPLLPLEDSPCELVLASRGDGFLAARSDMWVGDIRLDSIGGGWWRGASEAGESVFLAMTGEPKEIRVRRGDGVERTCLMSGRMRYITNRNSAPKVAETADTLSNRVAREAIPSSEADTRGRTVGSSPAKLPPVVAARVPESRSAAASFPEPEPDSELSRQLLKAAKTTKDPEVQERLVNWHERYFDRE